MLQKFIVKHEGCGLKYFLRLSNSDNNRKSEFVHNISQSTTVTSTYNHGLNPVIASFYILNQSVLVKFILQTWHMRIFETEICGKCVVLLTALGLNAVCVAIDKQNFRAFINHIF
jgi:hypothetical protein